MAVTTTGSLLVVGATWGAQHIGALPSGTYTLCAPHFAYVDGNPDGVLTCVGGSDVVYSIGNGKFYIGDVTNGVGGSTWTEIK